MATAYVASIFVKYQDGASEQISATCDDVTTNNWLGVDGLAPIRLSGAHGNAIIADIVLAPTPASTRTSTIRVNGKVIPEVVLHGANLGTTFGRQFQQQPLRLPAAATLTFAQLT
jgi:hypothetical protein